ncbi:ArdC family protein [Occallatibacter riparius]|uniref:ArdC-like ssDNA-binding domain-containing protein n=1 Tax=Occallatibacter riparius TaxID=1002689 RepID=A0A9J7BKM0_9BACT|nr:ArdC family protein [Occallatibacter riparius]UWZ81813.1 ArdC-like ssDNA-binding domain-containing protein [Occallatibacter riparius]
MSITNSVATNPTPHRKNAAQPIRSDSPYQGRTAQKDNPTQAIIRQAVDFLIEQVQAGKSDTLTAYLAAMSRFRNYSFGNILAIARQRPTATRVAGYGAWKELGRFVKRGERGIQILAPMTGYRRRKDGPERESDEKPRQVLIGFRAVHVFDVSQTEGADLPEFGIAVTGEVGEYRDRLRDFLAERAIELVYSENIAPAFGVSYGGKIALLPGQPQAQEFVTLVHEAAHELLHRTERRTFTTPTVRETEAEAVAFVVGQGIGLEMGTSSSDYIQMYSGNATLLAESLEVIQRTSAVILSALQPPVSNETQSTAPATDALEEVA